MPFIPNTPESLIPRSDSRNPATTCKGITSAGRPCRRPIASPKPSPAGSPGRGVVAILPHVNDSDEGAAAYFCWQHQDQAQALANGSSDAKLVPVQERTSIDSLVERVGVLDVDDGDKKRRKRSSRGGERVVRRSTLPQQWQKVQGPLMSVPEEALAGESQPRPKPSTQRQRRKADIHFSFFCCTTAPPDDDDTPPARPRPSPRPGMSQIGAHPPQRSSAPRPNVAPAPWVDTTSLSQTSTFLSLIPPSLPPATTSALMGELSKPLSLLDREPGYIYIFHLSTNPPPSPSQPRSLDLPSSRSGAAKPVLLKIGRASNVQRRMNEWSRQCGYSLSLVRYYPHVSSFSAPSPVASASSSPHPRRTSEPLAALPARQRRLSSDPATSPGLATPRRIPNIHRVERLIHIELADKRVKKECAGCGKEHREFFEVEGTRETLKGVDEVVKRWVQWGETAT